MNPRSLIAAWLLAVFCGAMAPAGADAGDQPLAVQGGAPPSAGVVRFRRVYAPLDALKDLTRGATRYLPMDRAEFEQLVRAAGAPAGIPTSAGQVLTTAQYRARLSGDALVGGEAILDVAGVRDAPALVPLDPCGLAVGEAVWLGEKRQPARLGLGADGRLAVLVERPGPLQLTWSLRGKRDAAGAVDFGLELPSCPSNSLVLDLPKSVTPLVDRGVVAAGTAGGEGTAQWRIELGGHHRVKLRVVPSEDLDPHRRLNRLRESLTYDFSLRGLDLAAVLNLDVPNIPLRQLTLELDAGLRLLTARSGDQPVAWSPMSPRKGSAKQRVMLELPEPIQGTARALRLTAAAPIEIGRLWRLPSIEAEGLFWQEGGATLRVSAPLAIQRLQTVDARQVGIAPLPAPQAGESLEVQYFSPKAGLTVLLAQPRPSLQVDCGTTLDLSGVEMTGRVVAAVRTAGGECFQVDADVGRFWTIHSVETTPANALDDWTFQDGRGTRGKLAVRLARGVLPSRPLRLIVAGRYLHAPLGRTLSADDLTPVRFRTASVGRRLTALRAGESYQLKLTEAGRLTRVDRENLTAADLELVAEPSRGPVFENLGPAASLLVALERQRPSYSAAIRVEAVAGEGSLVESCRVRCVPETGRVERVLVQLAQPQGVPWKWSFGPEGDEPITARAWRPSGAADGAAAAGGQTWEIALRRPRSTSFELHATRSLPWSGPSPLGLPSLPEAANQRGTVAIAVAGSAGVRIQNNRLSPIPVEQASVDQHGTTRAMFGYDPVREAALAAAEPAVVLAPGPRQEESLSAWVWSARLESRFEAGGTGRHLATYRLQNGGRERLEIILPPPLTVQNVRGVWVDRDRAAWTPVPSEEARSLAVTLPEGRRFPVVSVDFVTTGPPLGIVDRLESVMPETDLPTPARTWTVWLPPGYYASGDRSLFQPGEGGPATDFTQRLFGPLARRAGEPPCDPLAVEPWLRLAQWSSDAFRDSRNADLLLERLGGGEVSAVGAEEAGPESTERQKTAPPAWADRLAKAATDLGLTLLVDRPALSRAGVSPRTPIGAGAGSRDGDPGNQGLAALRQASLVLLLHGDAALLTGAVDAALEHACLVPVKPEVAWHVLPGPLAEHMLQASAARDDPWFLPIDVWRQLPAESRPPWTGVDVAGYGPSDALGWAVYRLEIDGGEATELPIFHRATIEALGWAAFLALFAAIVWIGGRRLGWLVVLAGATAVVALIVPESYVPIGSGVFLAALAGLVVRAASGGKGAESGDAESSPAAPPPGSSAGSGRTSAAVPAAMLLLGCVGAAWGGEVADKPAAPPGTIHSVFLPIDDKQQPAGDKVYVAEGLYGILQRLAAARAKELQGWQLTKATYRTSLAWQAVPEELAMGELKVTFDLQVLGRNVDVRIPLAHEGVRLVPGGALLDGRPIQPDWPEGSDRLVFPVAEPGPCRVELSLRPVVQAAGGWATFEMKIPRVAVSRLEATIPQDAPGLEVPSALGPVVREGQPPRIAAELGPTDRLRIRWLQGTAPGPGPTLDVEELLWLKVNPGAVVLDALLKFTVVEGHARQFELATDPRLQRFPLEREHSPIAQVKELPGQPQTLRFELSRPVAEPFAVPLSFLLTKSSGVGSLRLPYLAVVNARTTKRWMAVSVDPELRYEQQGGERLQAVAVPAFLAAWGESKAQPAFARAVGSPRPDWSLATRPVPPHTTAEQSLAVSLGPQSAQVILDALLLTRSGAAFQYKLSAPAAMEVERISLVTEGVQRAVRWSRGPCGSVFAFPDGPAAGKQELVLRGRMPVPEQGAFPLPVARLEGAEQKSLEIQVFRQPEVQVRVEKTTGLVEQISPAVEETKASLGRLVKAFKASGPERVEATLSVSRNRPQVRAEQVTLLRCGEEGWEAELDARIDVRGGVVDEFRLEAPPRWNGPYKVLPPSAVKVVDLPGKGRRQLVVRPQEAVAGTYRLRISGPLVVPAGERVEAVKIGLDQVEVLRHVLVLPTRLRDQPLTWETRGLIASPLPEPLSAAPAERDSLVAYRAIREPFQAVLTPPERRGSGPQVVLADMSISWNADGTCLGLAAFDLDPADLPTCTLRLPPDYRLDQVTVAGLPATLAAAGQRQWQVSLEPGRLPQRIEVLFSGRLPESAAAGSQPLAAPALNNLPVQQTLWSIAGPAQLEFRSGAGLEPIGRLQQELFRLRTIATMVQRALDVPVDDPEQRDRWFRAWTRRWSAAQDELRRQLLLAEAVQSAPEARAELEAIQRRQALVLQRLGVEEKWKDASAPAAVIEEPAELWLSALDRPQAVLRLAAGGGPDSISLLCRQSQPVPPISRLAGVLGVVAFTVLGAWAVRRPLFCEVLGRWPYAFGVAIGLAWWLWLAPSVVGWGVVLLSLLAALRSATRRRGRLAPRPSR